MPMHLLVEIAQGFNETRPSEMLFGVPAPSTGESVGALRITKQAHDSSREILGVRWNEHCQLFIEDCAVCRDVGRNDRTPCRQVVEHLEWEIAPM
jgi:hypothetical protein